MALGEIVAYKRGKGLSKSDKGTGNIPIVLYGELYTTYGNYITNIVSFASEKATKQSMPISSGAVLLPISSTTKEAQIGRTSVLKSEDIYLGGDAIALMPTQLITADYLMHVMNSGAFEKNKMKCVKGTTIRHLDVNKLLKIKVPVPPLGEQERIVAILDKFDALVNDISDGLPAEINARRQQYEYYRDKLLSFPVAA